MKIVKNNLARIKAAVEDDLHRLKSSNTLWAKNKAGEIESAISRVELIIDHLDKNIDLFDQGNSHLTTGDLNNSQLNWELLSSIDKMLSFTLNYWIEERTVTHYDYADNPVEREIAAHWGECCSLGRMLFNRSSYGYGSLQSFHNHTQY